MPEPEPVPLRREVEDTVWWPADRVRLLRSRLSSELDCGRTAEPVGEGVFRGGPAGVAFAHARILARVGSCSSEDVDDSWVESPGIGKEPA